MHRSVAVSLIVLASCGSYGDTSSSSSSSSGGSSGTPATCDSSVIYVSSKGDDANVGCEPQKPKRTLSSAMGAVQAKGSPAEIRACAETLRERVVLAYPASIVGGFDCVSWAAGAGRTTIEAPDDREVETFIAFGSALDASVRLEHLRIVGPTRSTGIASAVRVKDGAAPTMKDDELVGGTTDEGTVATLSVESGARPTIEDSIVKGGRARCSQSCSGTIATGVAINGAAPRISKTRIEGPEVDVDATGAYVGVVALDVFGGTKAAGEGAFRQLEIVHGVARIGGEQASYGIRAVGQAEVDLVDSKILAASSPSTCVSAKCTAVSAIAGDGKLRIQSSRVEGTPVEGAPGTTAVATESIGIVTGAGGAIEMASSFVKATTGAANAYSGSTIDVRASTLSAGAAVVYNFGSVVTLRSSIVVHSAAEGTSILSFACPAHASTTLESTMIVDAAAKAVGFFDGDATACNVTSSFDTPALAASGSTATNAFVSTASSRIPCAGSPGACVLSVFVTASDAKLKDGAPCSIAQGGIAFPEISSDLYGAPRSQPPSMGAHEYDGACAN